MGRDRRRRAPPPRRRPQPGQRPGDRPDPAFAGVAARLREAGTRVLGYADTAYGRRPHGEVVRDLVRYRDWYGTDGAFLDQAAADPAGFAHYQGLAVAAWGAGCGTLVLNHGTRPHPVYARIADVLVTFEGPWAAYRDLPAEPWPGGGAGVRLCHLVYGVPAGADAEGLARARGPRCTARCPGREIIRGVRCRTPWSPPVNRPAPLIALLLLLLAGCTSSPDGPDGPGGKPGDGGGERWRPRPGTAWQWQLSGRLDTSVDVPVYDIDGFDHPARTVAALHDDGRKVICYLSTGAWEEFRPDAGSSRRRCWAAATAGRASAGWTSAASTSWSR